MARIAGVTRGGSRLARVSFFLTRRKVGRVIRPVRVHAVLGRLLFGYGQMELAQENANRVPAELKALGQILVAMRVGCPF